MNELGMTLAWSAVQIALVMVPAAVLHVMASRRSAASGAWVATAGLVLSMTISVAAFLPLPSLRIGSQDIATSVDLNTPLLETSAGATAEISRRQVASPTVEGLRRDVAQSLSLVDVRAFLKRLELGTALPAARIRAWASPFAVAGIIGMGVGLLRLVLGLWAVSLCRRRGTIRTDPEWIELLDELRDAIGCRQSVEICEVPGLLTPATAGWRRPVVFLPDDWRSWDDTDRRAVLAHELAHVQRWDYAMGLAARLALALHFYQPLVRWMAGRLLLQQEFAADQVGARFAGGRDAYLSVLSTMALRQDGRSPHWPARAFLPARGTLIRRIAMLQKQSMTADRPWSVARRLLAAVSLLGLAAVVTTWRGPVRAAENDKPSDVVRGRVAAPRRDDKTRATPFDLQYMSDGAVGVVAFRPAATFRRSGMTRFSTLINESAIAALAKKYNAELSGPDRLNLSLDDIEWVAAGINFSHASSPHNSQRPMHSLVLERLTVRANAAFDWLKFLRQWHCEFREVREGDRVYYQVVGVMKPIMGVSPCAYLPDDRTIVLDDEPGIQKLLRRQKPVVPSYLTSPDWDRISRGLLAIAIQNQDGAFAKAYDLGRPDDAVVLSLFKGVDRWVLGVDDADAIELHAAAACQAGASTTIARAVEFLVQRERGAMLASHEPDATATDFENRFAILFKSFMTALRVGHDDGSVNLRAEGLGTLADLASLIEVSHQKRASRQ